MVIAGSIITSLSLGARATFGLYLDPVSETLGSGRGTFALTVAIQQIVWGLGQPVAGAVADRWGTGRVLAGGGGLFVFSLLLMGQSSEAWQIHATGGFMFGLAISAASFSVVLSAVGRAAHPDRRSMALGVVSALGSLGQFFLLPIADRLLDRFGWQDTVMLLSFAGALVVLFVGPLRGNAIFQTWVDPTEERLQAGRPDPQRTLRDELRKAASSRDYLLLNLGFFVCGFHVTSIATHLPAYADDVGLSDGIGSTAIALIGLFNVFGSLAAGALGQRYSKTGLLAGIYALRAVVIALYVVVPVSGVTTMAFAVTMGTLWLSTVPLTSGIVAQQFGTLHSGSLFGIVFLSHQIGSFLGAWGGGLLVDRFDTYNPVWWISVALGGVAMVAHLALNDGPVPDPPTSGGNSMRWLPAGAAAVLVLALAPPLLRATAAGGSQSHDLLLYCVL